MEFNPNDLEEVSSVNDIQLGDVVYMDYVAGSGWHKCEVTLIVNDCDMYEIHGKWYPANGIATLPPVIGYNLFERGRIFKMKANIDWHNTAWSIKINTVAERDAIYQFLKKEGFVVPAVTYPIPGYITNSMCRGVESKKILYAGEYPDVHTVVIDVEYELSVKKVGVSEAQIKLQKEISVIQDKLDELHLQLEKMQGIN